MPSSGYRSVDLIGDGGHRRAARIAGRAKVAIEHGLFIEWLEQFVGAWEQTHDADIASRAGLVEWDM